MSHRKSHYSSSSGGNEIKPTKPKGNVYTLFPLPSSSESPSNPSAGSSASSGSKRQVSTILDIESQQNSSKSVKRYQSHARSASNASIISNDSHYISTTTSGVCARTPGSRIPSSTPTTPTTPSSSYLNSPTTSSSMSLFKFSKEELLNAFTVSQTQQGYLLTFKHSIKVPLHPDDYKDKVILAIVKSLLLTGNTPWNPRDLATFIQDHDLVPLGNNSTPSASISSKLSQHFKRTDYIMSYNNISQAFSTSDEHNTAPITLSQSAINKLSSLEPYGLPLFRKTQCPSRGRKLLFSLARFHPNTLELTSTTNSSALRSHEREYLFHGEAYNSSQESNALPIIPQPDLAPLSEGPLLMMDPKTGQILTDEALESAIAELVGDVSAQVEQVLLNSQVQFADDPPIRAVDDQAKDLFPQEQSAVAAASFEIPEITIGDTAMSQSGTAGSETVSPTESTGVPTLLAPQPLQPLGPPPEQQLFPSASVWKSPVISPNVNPIAMNSASVSAVHLPGALLSAGKRLFSLDELDALLETEDIAPKRPFSTPPTSSMTEITSKGVMTFSRLMKRANDRSRSKPPSLLAIASSSVEKELVSSPASETVISPTDDGTTVNGDDGEEPLSPVRPLAMIRSQSVPVSSPHLNPTPTNNPTSVSKARRFPTTSTPTSKTPLRKTPSSKLHKRSHTILGSRTPSSTWYLDSPAAKVAAASVNAPYPSSTTLFDQDVELFFEFDPSFSSASGGDESDDGDDEDEGDIDDMVTFGEDDDGTLDSDDEDPTDLSNTLPPEVNLPSDSKYLLKLWNPTRLARYPLKQEHQTQGPIWLVKVQDTLFYLTLFCFDTRTLLCFPYDPSLQPPLCGQNLKECIRFIPLLRRTDNGIVNASSLLFAAGVISESEQTIALSMERIKIRVKKRNVLYGTWLPAHRARALAESCCLLPRLETFLSDDIRTDMFELGSSVDPVSIPEQEIIVEEEIQTESEQEDKAIVNEGSSDKMAGKDPRAMQTAVLSSLLSKLLASAKKGQTGASSSGNTKTTRSSTAQKDGNTATEAIANAQKILSALTALQQQQKNGSAASSGAKASGSTTARNGTSSFSTKKTAAKRTYAETATGSKTVIDLTADSRKSAKKMSSDTPSSLASRSVPQNPTPPSTPQPSSSMNAQALSSLLNTILGKKGAAKGSSSAPSASSTASAKRQSGAQSSASANTRKSTTSSASESGTSSQGSQQQLALKLLSALKPPAGTSKEQWASIVQAATKSLQGQKSSSNTPTGISSNSVKGKGKVVSHSTSSRNSDRVGAPAMSPTVSSSSTKRSSSNLSNVNPLVQKLLTMTGPLLQAYSSKQSSSSSNGSSKSAPSTPSSSSRGGSSSQSNAQANLLNNLLQMISKSQSNSDKPSVSVKKESNEVSARSSPRMSSNKITSSSPVQQVQSLKRPMTPSAMFTMQNSPENKAADTGSAGLLSDLSAKLSASGIDLDSLLGQVKSQPQASKGSPSTPVKVVAESPNALPVPLFPSDVSELANDETSHGNVTEGGETDFDWDAVFGSETGSSQNPVVLK